MRYLSKVREMDARDADIMRLWAAGYSTSDIIDALAPLHRFMSLGNVYAAVRLYRHRKDPLADDKSRGRAKAARYAPTISHYGGRHEA